MKIENEPFSIFDALGIIFVLISYFTGKGLFDAQTTQWDILYEGGNVMGVGMAMFIVNVLFFVPAAATLIYAIGRFKKRGFISTIPLIVNIGIIIFIMNYPFTEKWLDNKFNENIEGYKVVTSMIENGELEAERDDIFLMLPEEYKHLSARDGEVLVRIDDEATSIFFYTFSGVLDNYSGFLYRSNDDHPENIDVFGDWQSVDQVIPNWYFCASY